MSSNLAQKRNHVLTVCGVCGGEGLDLLIDLPEFPLTGIFVPEPVGNEDYLIDQGIMFCKGCGHLQLRNIIDPEVLYLSDKYTNRSSTCHTTISGSEFFVEFAQGATGRERWSHVLEIGSNDLFMLGKFAPLADRRTGVDPIWKGKDAEPVDEVRVVGQFIEELDFKGLFDGAPPDLIISSHNLEHIENPVSSYKKMMNQAGPETRFVMEVPCADLMVANGRFDQIFHQHIHYFNLHSMQRFIDRIGGKYLSHSYNYLNWGGTLIVAFEKRGDDNPADIPEANQLQPDVVQNSYRAFREHMQTLRIHLEELDGPLFGYGAGQMLPTFAYHMQSDLTFLDCIFDDNPQRNGSVYPGIPVRIRAPEGSDDWREATVLITALDSIRPILKRLVGLKPKSIRVPIDSF